MCPVPKPVQQPLDQEANSLSIAPVEVTTTLDTSVDATTLIQSIVSTPCTEDIIGALKIDNDGSSTSLKATSSENSIYCSDTKITQTLFPNSCQTHSPRRIPCISVDNCSNLMFHEETKLYHLSSIATDWTLLIDRQAANCRNISDEVFPSIYLGDRGAAKNAFYLKKVGVTHVINTAEGKKTGLVDTNEDFYYPYGIKYMGLKLFDVAQTNISKHFVDVSDYIDEALDEGGKVLVNCLKGMSRSSTVVLAYLMLRKNMTAMDALTIVRRHREVCPNDGFLKQLAELDNKLRRERGQLQLSSTTTPHAKMK